MFSVEGEDEHRFDMIDFITFYIIISKLLFRLFTSIYIFINGNYLIML